MIKSKNAHQKTKKTFENFDTFLKAHKIKLEKKPTPIGVTIPAPTENDLKWALDFCHRDVSKDMYFNDNLCKVKQLWRLDFMLSVKSVGSFFNMKNTSCALDSWSKEQILISTAEKGLDQTKVALSYAKPKFHSTLQLMLGLAPMDTFKYITNHYQYLIGQSGQNQNTSHGTVCKVIETGDLEKLSHLHSTGYNLFEQIEHKIDHALKHDQEHVAKFINDIYMSVYPDHTPLYRKRTEANDTASKYQEDYNKHAEKPVSETTVAAAFPSKAHKLSLAPLKPRKMQ